jgi:hypothetical protein
VVISRERGNVTHGSVIKASVRGVMVSSDIPTSEVESLLVVQYVLTLTICLLADAENFWIKTIFVSAPCC